MNTNSELGSLLNKSLAELSRGKGPEFLRNFLEQLSLRIGDDTISLSELLRNFNNGDGLQTSFEFPPYEAANPTPEVLNLPPEELGKITDGRTLVDIITQNFHASRPKPYKIGDTDLMDDKKYSSKEAASAIGIKESSLKIMHFESQGGMIYREPERTFLYSGYEVLRLNLKKKLDRLAFEKELPGFFYASEHVVKRLLDLKALKLNAQGSISKGSLMDFYGLVFPKKGTPRYDYVMQLNSERASSSTETVVIEPQIEKKAAAPPAIEAIVISKANAYYPGYENMYKPLSSVQSLFVEGRDYKLAPRAGKPYEDTFQIRHWDLKDDRKKRPENIQVNWRDIKILQLAKSFQDEETLKKIFEEQELPFDREYVLECLEKARQMPILYNHKLVFIPGTVQIVGLSPEEIEIIGEYTEPFINKYGPLISLKQISELVGPSFTQTDFLRTKKKEITSVKINDELMYNLFQVVRAYLPAFEKRA